ncbi:MAG: ankyrin repeat domain-containing protein [Bryobacterales bacterium]|nr:ankyrin repeat domain-containing protein [Bryobacterales bacterium]
MRILKIITTSLALAAAMTVAAAAGNNMENGNAALQEAIRQGDLSRMKALLEGGADANAVDEEGTPALMNAALYGGAAHMKVLLERGANVNAKNAAGATALIWAAGDAEKARLLVAAGADVNVQSMPGRTALQVAATAANGAATVKLLLDKGAKVDARDRIDPIPVLFTGGGKATPLIEASRVGDVATVRALLVAGADVNAKSAQGVTALSEAVLFGRREIVKELLASGAAVDGAVAMSRMPLLSMAAMRGDTAIARMLLGAGAKVSVADATGATPLMWAAFSDRVNADMAQLFLKAGADVKAVNKQGESALDWALARGETRVVKMLRKAGTTAKPAVAMEEPAAATEEVPVEATLRLLAKSGEGSFKNAGCATCHNHTLPLVAFAQASRNGIAVDRKAEKQLMAYVMSMAKPMTEILIEGSSAPPDLQVTGGYILEALAAQNYPADRLTAAMVHNIALQQMSDGRWVGFAPRPPLESGDIQATAMSIRALRLYPMEGRRDELNARVAKAGMWLRRAVPVTTEEHVMRLLGLKWAGIDAAEIRVSADRLMRLERAGGGWGQLPGLGSDAYATAKAVYALREVMGSSANVKAGMNYLRKTQLADGTWHVKTRSFALQPLRDTGFPHGRDQWISAAATSWAMIALIPDQGQKMQTKQLRPTRRSRAGSSD